MAEEYHFAQPNVSPPKKIFEPGESQLTGFQAVAWNTSLNGIIANKNHVEATITSTGSEYDKAKNDIATVQFQNRWGNIIGINGISPWEATKYGYDLNKVRLSLGATISVPQNTGGAKGYSVLYLRGIDTISKIRYWLQFSLFDEDGLRPDFFYKDVGLTEEACFSGQLGHSDFFSLLPTSASLKNSPFSALNFFGVSISRQQLGKLMIEFNNRLGIHIFPDPNLHRIFACGMTPELGAADPGGTMKFVGENMFLRTEFPSVSLFINKLAFINNVWKPGLRINTELGLDCSTRKDGDWSAHWRLNQVPGTPYFWIENRWRVGQRLNIEQGKLTSALIHDGALSAHWEFVEVGNAYIIQNRWKAGNRIHIENGKLDCGLISDDKVSARWLLKPVV